MATTFWPEQPSKKRDYIPSSRILSTQDSVISSPPSLLGHYFGSYSTQSKFDFGCISPPESISFDSQISQAKILWNLLPTLAGTVQASPGFYLQARFPVPQFLFLSHRQISNQTRVPVTDQGPTQSLLMKWKRKVIGFLVARTPKLSGKACR
jgi:hypothetical protein